MTRSPPNSGTPISVLHLEINEYQWILFANAKSFLSNSVLIRAPQSAPCWTYYRHSQYEKRVDKQVQCKVFDERVLFPGQSDCSKNV